MTLFKQNNMASPRPNNSNNSASTGGVSVVGVIQIVFLVLKLTKTGIVSSWPWWKVMLPIVCSMGLACCCGLTTCFMTVTWFACKIDKTEKNQVQVVGVDIESSPPPQIVVSNCYDSSTYCVGH